MNGGLNQTHIVVVPAIVPLRKGNSGGNIEGYITSSENPDCCKVQIYAFFLFELFFLFSAFSFLPSPFSRSQQQPVSVPMAVPRRKKNKEACRSVAIVWRDGGLLRPSIGTNLYIASSSLIPRRKRYCASWTSLAAA